MDGKKMTAMLMPIKAASKPKRDKPALAKPNETPGTSTPTPG
jgi:hypothetical protein